MSLSSSRPLFLAGIGLAALLAAGCGRDLVVPQQEAKPDQSRPAATPRAGYEEMFKTLGRAARSHQLADLVPFVSRRLRRELVQTLRRDRQRFWRHMDRVIRGIQSGLTVGTPVKRSDGRLELPLRFGNEDSIKPIIIIEDGQPRIDRF